MRSRLIGIVLVAGVALVGLDSRAANGINIIWESLNQSTHPGDLSGFDQEPPGTDPTSALLLDILEETEAVFEDAFEDSATIRITYWWDADMTGAGQSIPALIFEDPAGTLTHAIVRFNPNRNWFIDPTPEDDSEYQLEPVLYSFGTNTLTPNQQTNRFGGSPPSVFEAGFNGPAVSGGPADNNANGPQLDLLTVAFQEVCHSIGMNAGFSGVTNGSGTGEVDDGDYDVAPVLVGGASMTMTPRNAAPDPLDHLAGNDAVMGTLNSDERTRPSVADYFAIAAVQGWTNIDLPRQDFLGGANWNTDGNWMGNQIPGSADATFVRHGGSVTVDVGASVESLLVENASAVHVGSSLFFADDIEIQDSFAGGTSLFTLTSGGTVNTDSFTVGDDGLVIMTGGTIFAEDLLIRSLGEINGFGTINVDNVFGVLVNNGVISAAGNQEIVIDSDNVSGFDLDGTNESGVVELMFGSLRIETAVLDPIDTDITVGQGQHIAFNGGGATTLANGTLMLLDGVIGDAARVEGNQLQLSSGSVLRAGSLGIVENTLVLASGASVITAPGDSNSEIRLVGSTFFQGGSLTGIGTARQTGDAFFNADTFIDLDTYDMDGQVGNTVLTIDPGVSVTIFAPNIDTATDNAFDGTLHINGGTLFMQYNWTLDGTLHLTFDESTPELTGPGRITVSTDGVVNVSGSGRITSPLTLAGDLNVASVADLDGNTIIAATAQLDTNGLNDVINLNGTTVMGGGSYVGIGLLRFQGIVQVIGNTTIGMGQTDLDGTNTSGSLSIAPGVTLSVTSSTIDPTDGDYDDMMFLRGNFSSTVPLELTGTIEMTQQSGFAAPQLNGLSDFTIRPSGTVSIEGDGQINRDTTVQGALVVGEGIGQINAASIDFESTSFVVVRDAATLELNGTTNYQGGTHTGLGTIQFNGMTNINADTTISTARVDLDGASENTNLNLVDSQLTLNVDLIDTTSVNFNGLANLVGENAELTINLSSPTLGWRLMSGGQLNFSNPAAAAPIVTMLSGSPLSADGVINAVGPVRLGTDVAVRNRLNVNSAQSHVYFGGPGRSTIDANPMATVTGLGQITVDSGTTLNLENLSLVAVDTTNRGRLEVGFAASEVSVDYSVPATATIRGFFAQALTGEFAVDLGGTTQASEYDWLQVIGMARLSGTVEATFIDDFLPTIGDVFTILSATGGVDNQFDNVLAIDENNVLAYMLTDLYTATEAMLRVDDIFLIGDFNDDGIVDENDLDVWNLNYGSTGNPPYMLGDADGDGDTDGKDFLIWQEHFGQKFPTAPLEAARAPEPASATLALLALSALSFPTRQTNH